MKIKVGGKNLTDKILIEKKFNTYLVELWLNFQKGFKTL